jgi:outer membrane protein assembly factor BamA/autotransporter translocation and assembly factor TamB
LRIAAAIVAAGVALLLIAALVVHTPPVRRLVLRRTVATLADRLGIALHADVLRYNLLALRVTLTGVRAAAVETPDVPFLSADSIEITVPHSALFGRFALDRVRLENARLAILTRADGTTNLPTTESTGDEEPEAVPVERIEIPRLAVELSDERNNLLIALPALAVDVGRNSGSLRLVTPGQFRQGAISTTISRLEGGVSFDGRAVRIDEASIASSEGETRLDGSIAVLVREPRVDLTFAGTGDLAGLARWGTSDANATGALAFEGGLAGPFAAISARARINSTRVTWQMLSLTDVFLQLALTEERLQIPDLSANVAGGRVSGSVERIADSGLTTVDAQWAAVDLEMLRRALAPTSTVRPAARASGSAMLRGTGTDLAAWTIDAQTRLDAVSGRPGQIPIDGRVAARIEDGRWQISADNLVSGAPLRTNLRGALDAERPMNSTVAGTVALRESAIPSLVRALRSAGLVDVADDAVPTGTATAEATVSGTLGRPRFQMTGSGRNLARAPIAGVDVDLTAEGTPQQIAIDARLRQGDANVAIVSGNVWPEDRRLTARVSGTLRDVRSLMPDSPVAGTVDLDLQADGPFDALTARGTATVTGARYDDFDLGRLDATIAVDSSAARIGVVSPDFNARATADIARPEMQQAAVTLNVNEADLARLLGGRTMPAELRGRIGLSGRAQVPFDDWRRGTASIELTQLDARAGELPIRLAGPARASYDGEVVGVETLEADIGETRLSVTGRLPLSASTAPIATPDTLRAVLTGDFDHVLTAARASGLIDVPDISGRGALALLARVTGSIERPVVAADLDVSEGEVAFGDYPAARGIQLRARVADGWIDLLNATGEWQQSRFTADARIPIRLFDEYLPRDVIAALPATTGPARVNARATSITPAVLAPFVGPEALAQMEGVVDASVRLEAMSLDLEDLAGEAQLDRLDLRVAGLSVAQREPTRIVVEDGVTRVAAWDWIGQGANLTVQGDVRLRERQAALLAAGRVDLRIFAPFVSEAGLSVSGTLTPRVSVSGRLDDPSIDGELSLMAGEIRMREPRLIAGNLNAFAVMSPASARVTNLTGQINGGAFTGTASLDYASLENWSAQMTADVVGMGLEFPEGLRSEINADLALDLGASPRGPEGTVTGTVTVVRSAYREPIAVVTQLLTQLRAQRLAEFSTGAESMADRIVLNVGLVTDSDVVVDNNLARLQLGADLRVIGTAAQPSLSGRASLREGGQLILGQNVYAVESGTIDFANPVAIEPDLNIQATTRAGGYDIELTLQGTPETLSVNLQSPTADLDEADIASLLLTGRLLNNVAGAEAQIVGEQLLGYFSGDVLGIAGRAVGLDTIRLDSEVSSVRRDPAAIASEADPTSRLTFGKSFGDQIEVTFSQSLRQGTSTWIVDYQPLSQLDLRLVSRDDNLRSYEFRHDVAVGGGGPETRRAAGDRRQQQDIVAVDFTGTAPVPEEQLRDAAGLDAGDRFDVAEWQRAQDRLELLMQRQGFLEARVSTMRQEDTEGVRIVFHVEAGPPTSIVVDGYELPADARRAIEAAWTQSIFDDFLREEAAAFVRRALAEAGFLQPEVTVDLVTNGKKTLNIAVEPGIRAGDRRLQIAAGDESLSRELDAWVRARRLEEQAWRDPAAFDTALSAELRARGYLDGGVVVAEPRLDNETAVLVVTITPGQRFTIGEVRVPAAGVDADTVRNAAGLTAGTPYDPADVEAARQRVTRAYRRAGFAAARVTAEPMVNPTAHTVAISFNVEEGARDVLREIAVRGNRSVATDVVTRALDLEIGEPLSAEAWLEARSRLFDTALFRRVDVSAEPITEANDAGSDVVSGFSQTQTSERPMRLVVTIQEWPALRLRYGVQVSEERPVDDLNGRDLVPGLSIDVTRRTLFGRAITVGAAGEYQRRERLARLFGSAPTLAGLPIESTVTGERSRQSFADATFVTDRSRVVWEQRLRITTPFRLSYTYSFERNHTFDTRPPDPFVPSFDVTVTVARLTGAAVYDTRNDPTDTTRGLLVSSNLEYAPMRLGSDVAFVRHISQAYYFRPWRDVVLASAARVGIAVPRERQELIPSELFFTGGANTVRGVAEESLGPRDIFGFPAGGRSLLVFNQEVRFPMFWRVKGVVFQDAGNVFDHPRSVNLQGLVGSAGGGLRFVTPFGLLRVDYGRTWFGTPVNSGRWSFGIGQAF